MLPLHETSGKDPSLLIAMPTLTDPNFKRTVILLVDHSPKGAFGLVINRPSALSLRQVITTEDRNVPLEIPTWYGGPVDQKTGLILHNKTPFEKDNVLCEGVALSSTENALLKMIDETSARLELIRTGLVPPSPSALGSPFHGEASLYPWRFLIGYAGWGPGQLDDEVRFGGWVLAPLDRELVFNVPWSRMWESALGGLGVKPQDLAPTVQPWLN